MGLVEAWLTPQLLHRVFGLPIPLSERAADLLVIFDDFERLAIEEAHSKVTARERKEFRQSLHLGEALWHVERGGGGPVVFVQTDEQAESLRASSAPSEWADTYLRILKHHDRFGYATLADAQILIESKEDLDRNYKGNFYYYFA